jgi:hypothetical protein
MQFYIVTGFIMLYYILAPNSSWSNALTLFSAMIIHGMILGSGTELFGFIDHRLVVSSLIIFTAKIHQPQKIKVTPSLDTLKKNSLLLFILITVVYLNYIDLKNYIFNIDYEILFGGGTNNPLVIVKRIVRDIFFFYTFLIIFHRINEIKYHKAIEKGFLYGLVLAILSMLFYQQLNNLGFALKGGIDQQQHRLTGFMGVNANHAAAILNTLYGYILGKFEKKQFFSRRYLLISVLIIMGLIIVASKTGLTVFLILTALFLFKNYKKISKVSLRITVILIIGLFLYNEFGSYLEYRVERQISGEFDSLRGRFDYWGMYLNDIKENPLYLLFGNLDPPTYYRSVHNTYIEILFFGGLIPIIMLIKLLRNIVKDRKYYLNNPASFDPLYSILAVFISWMTGAGHYNYWILLIIGMSSGIAYLNKNTTALKNQNIKTARK